MLRPATVIVVDIAASYRESTARLLRSVGYGVETYAHPVELPERAPQDEPTCILLDLSRPGMVGLEVQSELARRGVTNPIIFMTACANDVPASVEAMKHGAVDFLVKPLDRERVLQAIDEALREDLRRRQARWEWEEARERVRRLTERERQVCGFVMAGLLNKQIAAEVGIAESTVKVHRSRMMEKLGVGSVIALVRLIDRARVLISARAAWALEEEGTPSPSPRRAGTAESEPCSPFPFTDTSQQRFPIGG